VGGAERLIIDPDKLSSASQRQSLYDWSISWDGNYVSYLVEAGGSEEGELRVVETATGKDMGERIDRTRFGSGDWLPDGTSFLYPRFPKLPEGTAKSGTWAVSSRPRPAIFRHGTTDLLRAAMFECQLIVDGERGAPWTRRVPHKHSTPRELPRSSDTYPRPYLAFYTAWKTARMSARGTIFLAALRKHLNNGDL